MIRALRSPELLVTALVAAVAKIDALWHVESGNEELDAIQLVGKLRRREALHRLRARPLTAQVTNAALSTERAAFVIRGGAG